MFVYEITRNIVVLVNTITFPPSSATGLVWGAVVHLLAPQRSDVDIGGLQLRRMCPIRPRPFAPLQLSYPPKWQSNQFFVKKIA